MSLFSIWGGCFFFFGARSSMDQVLITMCNDLSLVAQQERGQKGRRGSTRTNRV
jgi:hypothetical protein